MSVKIRDKATNRMYNEQRQLFYIKWCHILVVYHLLFNIFPYNPILRSAVNLKSKHLNNLQIRYANISVPLLK